MARYMPSPVVSLEAVAPWKVHICCASSCRQSSHSPSVSRLSRGSFFRKHSRIAAPIRKLILDAAWTQSESRFETNSRRYVRKEREHGKALSCFSKDQDQTHPEKRMRFLGIPDLLKGLSGLRDIRSGTRRIDFHLVYRSPCPAVGRRNRRLLADRCRLPGNMASPLPDTFISRTCLHSLVFNQTDWDQRGRP